MALRIPDKPAGARYTVTMYDPELRPQDIVMGLIRGGTAPLPAIPPRCVCCDAATERREPLHLSTGRYSTTPFDVPVCSDCAPHAVRPSLAGIGIAFGLILAISGICIGIGLENALLVIFGTMLGLFVAALAFVHGRGVKARAIEGHHLLSVAVTPGKTVVRTSNRRLVTAIIELNPKSARYVS